MEVSSGGVFDQEFEIQENGVWLFELVKSE